VSHVPQPYGTTNRPPGDAASSEPGVPPVPPVPGTPGPLGLLGRAVVFVAAFAVVSAGLRAVATPGGGSEIGSKVEHYVTDAARYDTVFVGTSHVFRAFVPEEFDARLGAAGVESSSFNLGVQLPNQLEIHYLTRLVLEHGGEHLERVFVQYHALAPQIDPDQAQNPRTIYWHDWEETALALERSRAIDRATPGGIPLVDDPENPNSILGLVESRLPSRYYLSRTHLQHWVRRELLVARRKDLARGLLGRSHGRTAAWGDLRGYVSLEAEERRLAEGGNPDNFLFRRREAFLEREGEYERLVDELRVEEEANGDEEWLGAELAVYPDLEAYRRMAALARAAGVELVVVVMPSLSATREVESRMEAELGVPVLRYNRPDEFPELYDTSLRFDSGHLSEEGARLFTGRLAADWLALERPGAAGGGTRTEEAEDDGLH